MSSITFKRVSKSYGRRTILNNLSFTFPEKSTTAVIGPSGSGKSTLLQIINGLVRPEQGELFLFGERLNYARLPQLRRKIGYALQGTGLFPHLTVGKNITLMAKLEHWPEEKIRSRLSTLLQLVGIPEIFLHKFPHQLSGGEQQRVGLCRAMILNPKLFLLDEPFGALDPITRSEIHQEFLKLQRSEVRTTILVTHDLREAIKLSDRIMILNHGNIEQFSSKADLLKNPATTFVEQFVHKQLE